MGLLAFITTMRYLLMFLCSTAFGFDMFFVYVYIHHREVVFGWKFHSETAIIGTLFWIIFLSELVYRIGNRMRGQRQYKYDTGNHAPYLPPTSSSHQHGSEDTSPDNTAIKTEDDIIIPYERRSPFGCRTFWSVARFLSVWALSAGLINIAVQTYQRQERFVFTIPFPRDSTRREISGYRYGDYNPHDIFNCPSLDLPDLLTTLCHFNQIVILVLSVIALLAVVEGLATVIFENRRPIHPSASSLMRKKAEHYDLAETGNAQVIVPVPSPHPVPETKPYGVYNQNASLAKENSYELDGRPLPALPPRPERDQELDGEGSGVDGMYSAAVGDSKKVGYSPFEDDLKDSKHAWVEQDQLNRAEGEHENDAGPSHTYPADVKRKSGL
ncbi:hypothetical protein BGX27_008005 [Mortierella sp. AM989]|nr:hypothetical protein BGX27_008005 [Mortierella sp. AM989]